MTVLEKEIKNIIEEIIEGKYIGKLKVEVEEIENEDPIWMLLLYLDMEQTPIILAHQGTEEQFKDFIRKEIKSRKLHTVHFWTAVQELPEYKDRCDE